MTPTPVEILDKVNSFYSGAFTQLITVTVAVLAFAGVILPVLIQIIQARSFRSEQASLKAHIDEQVKAAKSELANEVEKKWGSHEANFEKLIENKTKVIDGKMEQLSDNALGATFFVQARFDASQGRYSAAALGLGAAGQQLLRARDERNAQRAIKELTEECFPKLKKQSFEALADLETNVQGLIRTLQEKNEHGRYADMIEEVRRGLADAKSRVPL